MIKFDRKTFERMWLITKPFFSSEVKWQARGLLILLAVFALSVNGINVLLSYVQRDFMNAFWLKEEHEFFRYLVLYLLAFACATPVSVLYRYTEERLALLWRMWLSRQILRKYFSHIAYYKITSYEGIDNPDQRIEEDIRSFTTTTLSLFLIMTNALLALVSFVGILWTISFNLIIAVVLYAFCGSMLTYWIGRRLISLNFAQLKKEANYRYKLVNVRDNAESIAFLRGDRKELTRARQRLKKALENFLSIINLNRNLNFFITAYNSLKPVIPIVVVAPLFFAAKIQLGEVTQSADAFNRVVDALSVLISHFATISSVTAVVTRLGSFSEALDTAVKEDVAPDHLPRIATIIKPAIAFEHVTIYTPKHDQLLIQDLSFKLDHAGLLITGASGSGKSSILRVIAGLWNAGDGTVTRPDLAETIFVPQRPYMVLGTLRNQLLYSLTRRGVSDRELKKVMELVGLEDTLRRVHGLDAFSDWSSLLSTGEQQRLAFARLLLARPKFAFLDEATTAIDADAEAELYQLLMETVTAFVSVGYRANLSRYHHTVLELDGGGKWRLEQRRKFI